MNGEKLLQQRWLFIQQQLAKVEALGVTVQWMLIDHVCVRVDSDILYNQLKEYLAEQYPLLGWEKIIWWRPIVIFDIVNTYWQMSNPYDTLFELPAPKNNHSYPNWLQHIEIVFPWKLEELMFCYPSIDRNKDWFDKIHNRDLSLQFSDMTEVKFHEQSLRDVLAFEWK